MNLSITAAGLQGSPGLRGATFHSTRHTRFSLPPGTLQATPPRAQVSAETLRAYQPIRFGNAAADEAEMAFLKLRLSADKAQNWSYKNGTNGGMLSCTLYGIRYTIQRKYTHVRTPSGLNKTVDILTVKEPGKPRKTYNLSDSRLDMKDITHIAIAGTNEISREFTRIGEGLDLTQLLACMAKDTATGKLRWKRARKYFQFGEGLSIDAEEARKTWLGDGTRVTVYRNNIKPGKASDIFIQLDRKGLPQQILEPSKTPSEEKAAEFLDNALAINSVEADVWFSNGYYSVLPSLQQARELLVEEIKKFFENQSS